MMAEMSLVLLSGGESDLVGVVAGGGVGESDGDLGRDTVLGKASGEDVLEIQDLPVGNVGLPVEVAQHLAFHLVELLEREERLADDRPRVIRVGVVADHL